MDSLKPSATIQDLIDMLDAFLYAVRIGHPCVEPFRKACPTIYQAAAIALGIQPA